MTPAQIRQVSPYLAANTRHLSDAELNTIGRALAVANGGSAYEVQLVAHIQELAGATDAAAEFHDDMAADGMRSDRGIQPPEWKHSEDFWTEVPREAWCALVERLQTILVEHRSNEPRRYRNKSELNIALTPRTQNDDVWSGLAVTAAGVRIKRQVGITDLSHAGLYVFEAPADAEVPWAGFEVHHVNGKLLQLESLSEEQISDLIVRSATTKIVSLAHSFEG